MEGELYAQVTRVLGGSRFSVRCTDGFTRLMSLMKPQKRRADCICRVGDLVLVQRPLYATVDKQCFMRAKLSLPEVKQVRREGGVPVGWSESGMEGEEGDAGVFFDDAVLEEVEDEGAAAEEEVNVDDL